MKNKFSVLLTFISAFVLTILLSGCTAFNSSDYEGFIEEVKEDSIIIAPHVTDHEGDYPIYEIYLSTDTVIEGAKKNIDELESGDNVKVWIEEVGASKEIAERILIED